MQSKLIYFVEIARTVQITKLFWPLSPPQKKALMDLRKLCKYIVLWQSEFHLHSVQGKK